MPRMSRPPRRPHPTSQQATRCDRQGRKRYLHQPRRTQQHHRHHHSYEHHQIHRRRMAPLVSIRCSQATPHAILRYKRTHNPMAARHHGLLSRHRSSGVPCHLVAIPPPYSPISAAPSGPPPHPQPIVAAVGRTLTILTGFFQNEVRWCRKILLH